MLPFRSGRVCAGFRSATAWQAGRALFILILVCAFGSTAVGAGKGKKRLKKKSAETAEQKETDTIPLPVGHEAKGLVLPDYDRRGILHNRFEAGIARRVDADHMQMRDLDLTTYTAQQQPDLRIRMSDSILDLKTKVISSKERSTVRRKDFEIAGDTMQFDTNSRQGRMSGNVKMVITGQAELMPKGKP
jgi:hypothetical protein